MFTPDFNMNVIEGTLPPPPDPTETSEPIEEVPVDLAPFLGESAGDTPAIPDLEKCPNNEEELRPWGDWVTNLGKPTDTDPTDKVEFDWTVSKEGEDFLGFDEEAGQFVMLGEPDIGSYTISVVLKDAKEQTSKYSFEMEVLCTNKTYSASNSASNSTAFEEEVNEDDNNTEESVEVDMDLWASEHKSEPGLTVKPYAWVKEMDSNGLTTLAFSQPMRLPDKFKSRVQGRYLAHYNLTEVKNMTIMINGTEHPAMELQIIPGDSSSDDDLGFDYELIEMTADELTIQIKFHSPTTISQNKVSTFSMCRLINNPFFRSDERNVSDYVLGPGAFQKRDRCRNGPFDLLDRSNHLASNDH